MKSLLAGFLLLSFVTSANAVFTRDGGNNFATDDATNLDWLSLSETVGQAYNDAESLNSGWRYATNLEVENMFASIFPNVVYTAYYGYADLPLDTRFSELFGVTNGSGNSSFGLFLDDTDTLRIAGTSDYGGNTTRVLSSSYYINADSYRDQGRDIYGVFMVRNTTSSVSESSSLYLLALGLFGLFVAARRKV